MCSKVFSNKSLFLFTIITFVMIVVSNYFIFLVVPNERIMGTVQRIFYFHVSSAMACYCSIGIVFFSGWYYLKKLNYKADALMAAASEVGFVFCTIVLLSGMIWGHSAWNTWFRWEPRLVSFLLLWLVFLALNLLRVFGDPEKVGSHSAVVGIVGAFTVPIIVFSVKLLPLTAQLHPQVMENKGLKHPSYISTLIITMIAVVCLQFLLVWILTKFKLIEHRLNQLKGDS